MDPAPPIASPARAEQRWRIFHASPLDWGPPGERALQWAKRLDHVAACGFEQVLLAPPLDTGQQACGHLSAPADVHKLHARLGGGPVYDALAAVAVQCQERGMTLAMDLPLHLAAPEGPLARTLGIDDTASHRRDPRLDPRQAPVRTQSLPWPWARADAHDRLMDLAVGWVQTLASSGVRMFRCEPFGPSPAGRQAIEAPPWRSLIDAVRRHVPSTAFVAWTSALLPAQLSALRGAGFDAVSCSLPWWDFRAAWLTEELQRLRTLTGIADVIAAPEEPCASRLAGDSATTRRAMWAAVALGDGWLMPDGFEHGAREPQSTAVHPLHDAWPDRRDDDTAPFDLTSDVRRANAWLAGRGAALRDTGLRQLTGTTAGVTVMVRGTPGRIAAGDPASLVLALNPSETDRGRLRADRLLSDLPGAGRLVPAAGDLGQPAIDPNGTIDLAPAGVQLYDVEPATTVRPGNESTAAATQALQSAMSAPRIAIENVSPHVDRGRFAVRRVVGERVDVEADIWMDGHDQLAAAVRWRAADDATWHEESMRLRANDRWRGSFPLTSLGRHEYTVIAWRDAYGSWAHDVGKKHAAGVAQRVDVDEGRALIEAALKAPSARETGGGRPLQRLAPVLERLGLAPADAQGPAATRGAGSRSRPAAPAADLDQAGQLALLLDPNTVSAMGDLQQREFLSVHDAVLPVEAERLAARYASWYELFPRSQGPDERTHGTLVDVIAQLPRVKAMGFDVLYFPPIHPIGQAHRKGRNNTLTPGPDDPGSPYAIGSPDGGHDTIHPQLGTLDDFRRLRDAAAEHGLELALDFAIQCSPDHPWLKSHPEWFAFRADGTLRYAENPPKKYEDITNVDFYNAKDAPGLWRALRDIVRFWCGEGVRMFRVDNPHTKPLTFWEWMIADVRSTYPDAMFLAEAFTRPKMMARLAKVGFSQSYTYFTWRNEKAELVEYMTELTHGTLAECYRPHFFVNTPDINPHFLQSAGRPGFLLRAALATTLSGLWGMYNGFEVCDGAPHVVAGKAKEEYADSEKYQLRRWNWSQPGNIVAEVTRLNAIRRDNAALHSHLGLHFVPVADDHLIAYTKSTPDVAGDPDRYGDNVLLVVANLDPHHAHEASIEVPLWRFGLPDDGEVEMEDLMNGHRVTWRGKHQHVALDPRRTPFVIWRVRPA